MVEISIYIYRKNHNNLHFRFSLKHLIIHKKDLRKSLGLVLFWIDKQLYTYL